MLKSYIPGINSLIGPKRHYYIVSSENIVNDLHDWMDKHPHIIQCPHLSEYIFVKVNVTLVKKYKNCFKYQYMSSTVILYYQFLSFFGKTNKDGQVCIGDKYIRKYTPKHIKPMTNRNNITQ